MSKKMLKGKVISDKNEKTVVVLVKRRYSHAFFKKVCVKYLQPVRRHHYAGQSHIPHLDHRANR